MKNRWYISTPLYYVNDVPHLGHAYTTIAADAATRYHRLCGDDVFFLTGTDEHGQKVERSAEAAGVAPQAYVDQIVTKFQDLWRELGIEHDDFIRTTQDRHKQGVYAILERMKAAGDIYKDTYEGWYCTGCEAFYPESQLVEGNCPDGHEKVERLEEESWFFRLSKYQEPLLQHYKDNPEFVRPKGRFNEVISFVESGLKDLSVSRTSVNWGVPWPGDPGHVMYVWLDALSNYITALGFGQDDPSRYEKYWPVNVHLIGKEIIRFHAVFWPAFLMSAGLPLPRQVFAHGWLLAEDRKMSKSFGNALEPKAYLNTIGRDALRYCLLRDVAFGQDGSFSDEGFIDRTNADLANDLGNLVSRVTKMIGDWCGGEIPAPHHCSAEKALETAAANALLGYRKAFDRLEIHRALQSCWELIGAVNKFVDEQKPWKLRKMEDKREHLGGVLWSAAEAIRWTAILISPVMPETGERIFRAFGIGGQPADSRLDSLSWGDLKPGGRLGEREALFPRLDKPEMMDRIARERKERSTVTEQETSQPETKEEKPAPETPTVDIDTFKKIDFRVARVIEAEAVEGADKLIVMKVDLGSETRQIVAGVREHYTPEEMVGREIILVANLKPATIRGVRSQGMLLAAHDSEGVVVAGFQRSVAPGSPVS